MIPRLGYHWHWQQGIDISNPAGSAVVFTAPLGSYRQCDGKNTQTQHFMLTLATATRAVSAILLSVFVFIQMEGKHPAWLSEFRGRKS
jgi:hypothetical protein